MSTALPSENENDNVEEIENSSDIEIENSKSNEKYKPLLSETPDAKGAGSSSDNAIKVPPVPTVGDDIDPVEIERVIKRRLRSKTNPSISDINRLKIPLDKLSPLARKRHEAYYHGILHLGSHGKCDICDVAKQRRARHSAVPESKKVYETVLFGKTSFETLETGKHNLCKGVGGKVYALCPKDEASTYASFYPAKKKDHVATGLGLADHFGTDIKKAGKFYCDGAPAFVKIADVLRIPKRLSTPHTPTSHSRQETWMRILGDGIRTLLYSAGLSLAWWPFAGAYYCLAHNATY